MSLPPDSSVNVSNLSAAIDALGLALYVKDAAGRYTHLNEAAAAMLGGAQPDRSDADMQTPATAGALRAADQSALSQQDTTLSEHSLDIGGKRREVVAVRVPLGGGALLGLWLERSERTRLAGDLQQALTQLEDQQRTNELLRGEIEGRAQQDGATRLVRREQFEDQLRREIDLSLREHREFAVVYVHVDPAPDGTPPQDSSGRDRVIEALGRLLRGNTRAMDAPSQLDGERFAVLLSGVGLATAHSRMEGLRRQCATQIVVRQGAALRFTVSMGVASFPHTSQTQAGLLHAAEAALAQARGRGGNHVALASIAFGGVPAA
ncbi:diguanylate cyclase [Methylibium sp.]|uniref:GGDEF domain-containing protein n=1 Tax=Methylibium sp. TaxID=2067992 RepID=UPI0017B95E09|nr:diguanylate cyclase [Methylibium sp.]MBA3589029.1 diguanylate cyclase [Methylibium sp.]